MYVVVFDFVVAGRGSFFPSEAGEADTAGGTIAAMCMSVPVRGLGFEDGSFGGDVACVAGWSSRCEQGCCEV